MYVLVGAFQLDRQTKEAIWLACGVIGFFSILFVPQLRDPLIVTLIFGLLGLPAFYEMAKKGNGANGKNSKNESGTGSL